MSVAEAEIKPGQINQVVGNNNQGKSTILKAFEFAVKGSSDSSLVRLGEDSAEVIVELADETVIRRRLSAQGKQSVTVSKGEFVTKSPQGLLDGMFAAGSFNPIALLDPSARHSTIMSSIDLKLDQKKLSDLLGILPEKLPMVNYEQHGLRVLDEVYKYFYVRRAEANKDHVEKTNRLKAFQEDLEKTVVPEGAMSMEKITTEENRLNESLRAVDREIQIEQEGLRQYQRMNDSYTALLIKIKDAENQIAIWNEKIKLMNNSISEWTKEAQVISNEAQTLKEKSMPPSDLVSVKNNLKIELAELQSHKATVALVETRKRLEEKVQIMKREADAAKDTAKLYDDRVQMLIKEVKPKLMAEVEMPIKGLEYLGGEFFVDGVRVDNLSSSHAMVLAIKIARKLSKKTKVICIDGAEMLDEQTFKILHEEIKDDGYTYFVSKVGAAFGTEDNVITMKAGQVQQ